MRLAYLDDSDTKAKSRKWQVISAVVIKSELFNVIEKRMTMISEQLMGTDLAAAFREFHAAELYGGYGVFEGIEEARRLDAIRSLLSILNDGAVTIVYGAVDLEELQKQIYGSADPIDVCFRKCLDEIRSWAKLPDNSGLNAQFRSEDGTEVRGKIDIPQWNDPIMLIVDDFGSKINATLQNSFRSLRPFQADYFHDNIYFGDSRYSIGIQLADLSSYLIARFLEGSTEIAVFYEIIAPRIYRSGTTPVLCT